MFHLLQVEIMYKVKTIVLPDHYTLMDVAYIYTWKRVSFQSLYFLFILILPVVYLIIYCYYPIVYLYGQSHNLTLNFDCN